MKKSLFLFLLLVTPLIYAKSALEWFEKGCSEKRTDKKIKLLTKAIEIDPKFMLAYKNRAFAMEEKEFYSGAINDYTKILELKPNYSEAYAYRARAYEKMGNLTQALADYNKAIELDPSETSNYTLRGNILSKMNMNGDAESDYKMSLNPEITKSPAQAPNPEVASPSAQPVQVASNPAPSEEPKKESLIERIRKHNLELYQKSLKPAVLPPDNEDKTEKKETSEPAKPTPAPSEVKKQELPVEKQEAKPASSVPSLPASESKPKAEPSPEKTDFLALGLKAKLNGQFENAVQLFTKAISANTKNSKAYAERGDIRTSLGLYEDALKDFNQAIEFEANNAIYYCKRGLTQKWLKNRDKAMSDYEKALKLDPSLPEAWYNIGWMKYNTGDFAGAIRDFDKAISLKPDYASAYNTRGFAKEDNGDKAGAEVDFKKYKQLTGI